MIFPPMPKGAERDDTEHGKLYYTRDQMRKYGLQCVEEYKRCMAENKPTPADNKAGFQSAFNELFKGLKK